MLGRRRLKKEKLWSLILLLGVMLLIATLSLQPGPDSAALTNRIVRVTNAINQLVNGRAMDAGHVYRTPEARARGGIWASRAGRRAFLPRMGPAASGEVGDPLLYGMLAHRPVLEGLHPRPRVRHHRLPFRCDGVCAFGAGGEGVDRAEPPVLANASFGWPSMSYVDAQFVKASMITTGKSIRWNQMTFRHIKM